MPRSALTAPRPLPDVVLERLCERFPLLLRGWTELDPSLAPLERAIRCGAGWLGVVEVAFEALESAIEDAMVGGGRLRSMPSPYHVRERFGELRIELLHPTEHSDRVVETAAQMSTQLCPACGAMAFLRDDRRRGCKRCKRGEKIS
jgi:hypothetical protein